MYDLKIQLLLSCPDYIYYKIVTNIWPCYNYIFIWNKGKNIKTELSIFQSVTTSFYQALRNIYSIHTIRTVWRTYGSDSPGRGKWSKCGIFLFFLKLCCDQTVRVFQLLSTVLKRFCLVHPKNVSILVLAIFLIEQFSLILFTPNWRFLALFEVRIEPSCN